MKRWSVADIRTHAVEARGAGGDYHDRESVHWLVDGAIATPMSGYLTFRQSRTSWGINALVSILVEIECEDGTIGVATGLSGDPACFLIEKHFRRFLVRSDVQDVQRLWDQMYHAILSYGRRGLALAAISAVDLANRLRDLLINWIEKPLSPDDADGHRLLKERAPWQRWTSSVHEYARYGYRNLILSHAVDIIQPDLMWMGG